jgi:hypothetical protein
MARPPASPPACLWEPLAEDWPTANVATEAADPTSLLATYRHAIGFREGHVALSEGGTFLVDGGAPTVIGWLRATADERLLVVLNLGAAEVTDYHLSLGGGPLCGAAAATYLGAVGDPSTPAVAAPAINGTGGFDALPAHHGRSSPGAAYVISLDGPVSVRPAEPAIADQQPAPRSIPARRFLVELASCTRCSWSAAS